MFHLQLVYLTGLSAAVLVHTSPDCLIPPQLLLSASSWEVVMGASHLLEPGELQLLRHFLYNREGQL